MSSEWALKCEELHKAATDSGTDCVFPVFLGDEGYSDRWYYFSVFTNENDNWCRFGRTRVMFDSVAGQWNRQCRGTEKSHRCVHRMIAMWWIFQEFPDTLLANIDIQNDDIDDLETHIVDNSITWEPNNLNSTNICAMTEYLYTNKRIPSLQDLFVELRTTEAKPPPGFVPSETTCPYCPGPTPPALNPHKILTAQATVYGINYIQKGKYISSTILSICICMFSCKYLGVTVVHK